MDHPDRNYHEMDADGDVLLTLELPAATPGGAAYAPIDLTAGDGETEDNGSGSGNLILRFDGSGSGSGNVIIRFLVSSKKLASSSPYFRAMFGRHWAEGARLVAGQVPEFRQQSPDVRSFGILMNVLHGHTKKVPRNIDLPSLTNIAILIDYYNCLEGIGLFAEIWIERWKKRGIAYPTTFELASWIWIAYVFKDGELFTAVTKVAIAGGRGPLQVWHLPIPSRIVDDIDSHRIYWISRLVSTLQGLKEQLRMDEWYPRRGCSLDCVCMMLGSLTRLMARMFSSHPAAPFGGISFAASVCGMRAGSHDYPAFTHYTGHAPASCSLRKHLEPIILGVERNMTGLKLAEYVGP